MNFAHTANRKLIAYLLARSPDDRAAERDPEATRDPYNALEAQPAAVARLWDDFSARLPGDCRWILYDHPVLVHPDTGVVFGWAVASAYALRLPVHEHAAAIRAGATTVHHHPAQPVQRLGPRIHDLADVGAEWVFGGWFEGEELWCMAAYNEAGKVD